MVTKSVKVVAGIVSAVISLVLLSMAPLNEGAEIFRATVFTAIVAGVVYFGCLWLDDLRKAIIRRKCARQIRLNRIAADIRRYSGEFGPRFRRFLLRSTHNVGIRYHFFPKMPWFLIEIQAVAPHTYPLDNPRGVEHDLERISAELPHEPFRFGKRWQVKNSLFITCSHTGFGGQS